MFRRNASGLRLPATGGAKRGDMIAFTDDDAAPEPSWLEQMLSRGRDYPAMSG